MAQRRTQGPSVQPAGIAPRDSAGQETGLQPYDLGGLVPPGQRASVLDVDWHEIFGVRMMQSYIRPFRERHLAHALPDGRLDTAKLETNLPLNGRRKHLDADGRPNVALIIADLGRNQIDCEQFFIAIPSRDVLEPAELAELTPALVAHLQFLLRRGKIPSFFEWAENVLPGLFDSFGIVEALLPKMVRRGYVEHIPIYSSISMYGKKSSNIGEIRKKLAKLFPGEEDELCREIEASPDLLFFWRELACRDAFPLKNGGVLRLDETTG